MNARFFGKLSVKKSKGVDELALLGCTKP